MRRHFSHGLSVVGVFLLITLPRVTASPLTIRAAGPSAANNIDPTASSEIPPLPDEIWPVEFFQSKDNSLAIVIDRFYGFKAQHEDGKVIEFRYPETNGVPLMDFGYSMHPWTGHDFDNWYQAHGMIIMFDSPHNGFDFPTKILSRLVFDDDGRIDGRVDGTPCLIKFRQDARKKLNEWIKEATKGKGKETEVMGEEEVKRDKEREENRRKGEQEGRSRIIQANITRKKRLLENSVRDAKDAVRQAEEDIRNNRDALTAIQRKRRLKQLKKELKQKEKTLENCRKGLSCAVM
ncbi:hypothetical protein C8R41DRAFT_826238 [Lentinula lateritia]|uniref:Uncharacterized protein n=1 Tax=Lentinula lateritia TaxID=40482 RepID=A0ABQ8VJN7_9AGAR|nr:hypothetical protein C8R41DRAFT_826238 [Lentinula lateritia]